MCPDKQNLSADGEGLGISYRTLQESALERYASLAGAQHAALAEAFPVFGIHHCGPNMETVIEGYLQVPNLRFLEIGAGSDLEAVARALREKGREDIVSCIRYSPVKLKEADAQTIRADTQRAVDAFGSDKNLCFSCVGIDADVDIARVRDYLSVFRDGE